MRRRTPHPRTPRREAALPGVLIAALALAGAVATEGPPAAAAGPRPAAVAPCTAEAPDEGAAVALAQRCDTEVEVVAARTEWNTTVALPDGTMRLDVSTAAVRTDESGEWADVDNAVVASDGALSVASAVTPMTFSDGSGEEPFARIERDGHVLTFAMPFDLPRPSVAGAQVTYAEVLPGVDLVVTVNEDATGFSEVLRVDSPEAAAHPDLANLTFPVATSDGIEVEAKDGGFVAADESGAAVFASPVPAMWDSSAPAPEASGAPDAAVGEELAEGDPVVEPVGGEEVAALPADVTADEVTVTPDAEMLESPETVWPVFIDPGVSGALNRRSAVRTVFGTKYDFTGDEGVGLCSTASSSTCSSTFRSRLLYQFAGLQGIGDLEPGHVLGATFAVTGTHSYSCTPQPVTLYAVADFDAGTAYPGGGYWNALHTLTIAHRAGCAAGLDPRRIEFNATAQAQAVAAANTGLASFGIASDESSMAYWKRYGWDASFSVVYNRPPNHPAEARTTTPESACVVGAGRPTLRSASPVLRARLSDPDGGNVHAKFDIVRADNGALVWDPAATPAQGSGAEHAVQVPATLGQGGPFQWRVRGIDDSGAVGPVAACEFNVDLEAPVMPTVAPLAGQAAVYAEDALRGGAGVPGLFTFGRSTSADVVKFRYSFDNTGFANEVPAITPSITHTPKTGGPHVLYVQSVDAAGWPSPTREYRFVVDTAAVSDAWRFDETSGTTAASVVTSRPNPLAVSSSVTRVDGLLAELNGKPQDRALQFDEASDVASSAVRVVDTAGTFGVMAYVKSDDAARTAVAVSQDGRQVSGFSLGQLSDSRCPTASKTCWAFWVPSSDSTGASTVAAVSTVPVRAGYWVQLAAARTADNRLTLSVCEIPRATDDWDRDPVQAAAQPAPSAWAAAGQLRVGRGLVAGAAGNAWRGAVGEVRTYTSGVDEAKLFTSCHNPAAIVPVLDPAATPPTVVRKNADGADFDGNGKADVFWSNPADGLWRVSFNGTTPWVVVNGAGAFTTDQFRFGDIDGDGRDDVFFANPGDGRWLVSYGATSAWDAVNSAGVPNDQLALADLDGNGKVDVFWSNPATGAWYVSDGARSAWRHINGAAGIPTSALRFGDVNGDGKDDVFHANPADGRWYASYGGGTPWQPLAYANVPNDQLLLGDLTGDGKDDVFWVNPATGLWYYSSGGLEGWRQINGAPGVRTDQFQLADMSGDGKVDVFFANPGDGRWLVSDGGTSGWTSVNGASEAGAQPRVR
ncbi:FG-GAP repeat domain-containing protein [Cellulomonas sp. NPDC055163]